MHEKPQAGSASNLASSPNPGKVKELLFQDGPMQREDGHVSISYHKSRANETTSQRQILEDNRLLKLGHSFVSDARERKEATFECIGDIVRHGDGSERTKLREGSIGEQLIISFRNFFWNSRHCTDHCPVRPNHEQNCIFERYIKTRFHPKLFLFQKPMCHTDPNR